MLRKIKLIGFYFESVKASLPVTPALYIKNNVFIVDMILNPLYHETFTFLLFDNQSSTQMRSDFYWTVVLFMNFLHLFFFWTSFLDGSGKKHLKSDQKCGKKKMKRFLENISEITLIFDPCNKVKQ